MNMETEEGMRKYCNQVAKKNNWILNKDEQSLNDLIDGLVENKKRYGYQSCPCRLAAGKRELDRDIICPCNYAPLDVKEHGACYCNLFLALDFYKGDKLFVNVPERRSVEKEKATLEYMNENI